MVMRIGLAGYGRRGKGHLKAIEAIGTCELTAIADPTEAARFEAEAAYGEKVSLNESAEEMVDSGEVDAVVVAAPAHLNGVVALPLISRSVPVLIEKPPGLSYAEVADLREASTKTGSPVMVAFNRRFNPLVRSAIDEVANAGDLHQLVAEFHKNIHDFTDDPRYSPDIMDLMLLESPIHSVDLVLHIAASRFSEVHSIVKRKVSGLRDVHAALIEFENGAVCQFTAAYTAGGRLERYELHGEYVSAYLEGVNRGWVLGPSSEERPLEVKYVPAIDTELQMAHFVDCLENGKDFGPLGADLDSSLETLRLCETILSGTS